MAEQDEHNYSSSSPKRVPAVPESCPLNDGSPPPQRAISTGLKALDALLQGRDPRPSQDPPAGGLSPGEITEVYGPPGVGKTALALRVASMEMTSDHSVIWVDTSSVFPTGRLRSMVESNSAPDEASQPSSSKDRSQNTRHFITPTLPHLLALFAHATESFPPKDTSLIVIDSISTLFALAFPKRGEDRPDQAAPQRRRESTQWASGRKWAVMSDLVSKLGKLASSRNIAILLISRTITKVRSDSGAFLTPAISGTVWDGAIANRVVLFRDWLRPSTGLKDAKQKRNVRFAGVLKAKGVIRDLAKNLAAFTIEKDGPHEVKLDTATTIQHATSPPTGPTKHKRKRDEIGDSESGDEDVGSDIEYGWEAEDDTLSARRSC